MFRRIRTSIIVVFAAVSLVSGCTGGAGKTKESLLSEGIKLLNGNNPRGAIVLFRNALEKDRNFFEARFQLARATRFRSENELCGGLLPAFLLTSSLLGHEPRGLTPLAYLLATATI